MADDGRRFPLVMYLVNNGHVIEMANRVFFESRYDIRSLKAPFFAGMVVMDENYNVTRHPFGLITDPGLEQTVDSINYRNGVVVYVEDAPGQMMMRGISRQNPKFVEAFGKSIVTMGYSIARVTYGEPPDPNWRPDLPDAKPYVPFLERP